MIREKVSQWDFWGFGRDVSAIKKGPEAKGNRTLLHNFKGKISRGGLSQAEDGY